MRLERIYRRLAGTACPPLEHLLSGRRVFLQRSLLMV